MTLLDIFGFDAGTLIALTLLGIAAQVFILFMIIKFAVMEAIKKSGLLRQVRMANHLKLIELKKAGIADEEIEQIRMELDKIESLESDLLLRKIQRDEFEKKKKEFILE
jgi:hypothetical protein